MSKINDLLKEKGFQALTKSDRHGFDAGKDAVILESNSKTFLHDEGLLEVVNEDGTFCHFETEEEITLILELI